MIVKAIGLPCILSGLGYSEFRLAYTLYDYRPTLHVSVCLTED